MGAKLLTTENAFSSLSLGNIGSDIYSCDSKDMSTADTTFNFKCGVGKLGVIIDMGVVTDNTYSCEQAVRKPDSFDQNIDEKCHQELELPFED
jgi:hypothetical protein